VPDLFIDFDVLSRAQRDMEGISDLLRRPVDALRASAGRATAHDRLRQRLEEFGEEWDHGIGQLGKYADGCSAALGNVRAQFEKLDSELAKAFDEVER
jgi:hypothetical protein